MYTGCFAVILGSHWLGLWLSTLLLIPLVTLWLSVQHELLHGHPTRSLLLNKLLGYAPFAVWYPYTLYRDSHLLHHNDEDLTLPGIDPEPVAVRGGSLHRAARCVGPTAHLYKPGIC